MTTSRNRVWLRLTIGFVAIIMVTNVAVFVVTVFGAKRIITEEAQSRVRMDLNSADRVFEEHAADICLLLRGASVRRNVPSPLRGWNKKDLHGFLASVRKAGGLDVLSLLDKDGRVVYREHNPGQMGDDMSHNSIVVRALGRKGCVHGIAIIRHMDLEREGSDLLHRASLRTNSKIGQAAARRIHHDGMIIGAAVPLVDLRRGGGVVGYLYGAKLLNDSSTIVDEIKEDLYKSSAGVEKNLGVVSIVQGDVRVSTSMKTNSGLRPVGTLVSPTVTKNVLKKNKPWVGRAFVVNDWYISAYAPIRDPENKVIGMVAVGMREKPLLRNWKRAAWIFLGVVSVLTIVSLLLLALMARTILYPIAQIIDMSKKVVSGDLSIRLKVRPPGELGLLCIAVNKMADAVMQREESLVQATCQQVGRSEKMAAVGRMAAGVSHEINNPLTGLLTLEYLLKKEEGLSDKATEYLDIMYKETLRMREIILSLLNFAHESSVEMKPVEVNDVGRDWLKLLRSQKEFRNITIEEHFGEGLPKVNGDANQLQQVFANISLNACEAMMPDGGVLTITTLEKEGKVQILIQDTGCGIKEEHLKMIFDPFFTTKPVGQGTGLGLSVSYGIITNHGGIMDVKSQEGKGTTFIITLPTGAQASSGDRPVDS